MKHLMHKSFFNRNTGRGVAVYLSKVGIEPPYEFVEGPSKDFVYAVCGEDLPGAVYVSRETEVDDGTDEVLDLITAVGGIPKYVLDVLVEAGYDTVTKVRAASDDELLAVDGIGEGRLRAIRKVIDAFD